MIDRSPSRLHYCLRQGTIRAATLISLGAFLLFPLAALFCAFVGGLAYAGCALAMALLGLAGGLLVIVGGIALVGGVLGGRSEAIGRGVLASGVGLAGIVAHDDWNKPVCAAGEAALTRCTQGAEFFATQVFLGHKVYLWSWSVLAIATAFALAVLATIGILRWETLVKARLLGIRYTCPECHEQGVPQFRCPGCSTLASDLAPSPYGVFHARCGTCQAELPTVDCFGRLALQKVCRLCSADLVHPAIGKQREVHFAVVGAQSSGKTTWMVTSVWQLAQQFAPKFGLQVDFSSKRQKKALHDTVEGLATGARLAKTASISQPRAFNLSIHAPGASGSLLYLYDAAGEDLTEEARMSSHRFHRFADGLLLVIDPFAEALARPDAHGPIDQNAWSAVNPAATNVASVIEPFTNRLEQQMNVSAESMFPIPVAVVVTKMAAMPKMPWPDLRRNRGAVARTALCRQGHGKTASATERSSSLIREFLLELGLANVVANLETRFRKVAYFATSAVEELPSTNRRPAPSRAAMPLLWLIHQAAALPVVPPSVGRATPQPLKATSQPGQERYSSPTT